MAKGCDHVVNGFVIMYSMGEKCVWRKLDVILTYFQRFHFGTMLNMSILQCELVEIVYCLVLTYAPVGFFLHSVPSVWHLLVMVFCFPLPCLTYV